MLKVTIEGASGALQKLTEHALEKTMEESTLAVGVPVLEARNGDIDADATSFAEAAAEGEDGAEAGAHAKLGGRAMV